MILKFNESSEFGEVKNILNDLEGIMIELYDNHIDIDIEPSSDYAIELSLEELEYEGFYITFKHLSDKRRLYPLITETIHMIIDYMNLKEFDTHILVLESPKHHLSKDYKKTYDRIVTIEELEMIKDINYIEVSFTKKKRNSHLNENVEICRFEDFELNEGLPNSHTVDQWKKLRKLTKGIDIGDRVSDMNDEGANLHYMHNAVDTGIESFQDFEKKNKKFVPSWNLKNVDQFGKKYTKKEKK